MCTLYPTVKNCRDPNHYHLSNMFTISEVEVSLEDAVSLIKFYRDLGECCFLYCYPNRGICLYHCKDTVITCLGVIENTKGFFYCIQDPCDPYQLFILAKSGPSNIISTVEYGSHSFQVDLNPPPHDYQSGIYRLKPNQLELLQPFNSREFEPFVDSLFFFKNRIFYQERDNVYLCSGKTKRYKNRLKLLNPKLAINKHGMIVKGEDGQYDLLSSNK